MKKNNLNLLIESHLLFEHEFWMRKILFENADGWEAWQKLQRIITPIKATFNQERHPGMPATLAEIVNQRLQLAVESFVKDPNLTAESLTTMVQTLQTFSKELLNLFSTESFAEVIQRIHAKQIAAKKNLPLVQVLDYTDTKQLLPWLAAKVKSVSALAGYLKVTDQQLAKMFLSMKYDDLKELCIDNAELSKNHNGMNIINKIDGLVMKAGGVAQPTQTPSSAQVSLAQTGAQPRTSVSQIKAKFREAFQNVSPEDRAAIPSSVKNSLGNFVIVLNTLEKQEAMQTQNQQSA